MQLILRLAKLLGQGSELPRGLIQQIARETGLKRHCVSSLLHGEAKYVSLDALGRICKVIAQRQSIDARTLAAELFAFLPDELWKILVECDLSQFCLGKRHVPNWPGKDYVMASDSYLQGIILSQISDPSLRREVSGASTHHFPPPYLLLSSGERQFGKQVPQPQKLIDEARRLRSACRARASSGLIGIGSVKVNTLVELLFAEWFHAEPGVPQDDFDHPRQRSVPLFLCYRDDDVQPRSCCGGTRLSKRRKRDAPGIYFEGDGGKWKFCACDDGVRDAAFLVYAYRPMMKQVELACGGFSGEATAALAARLNRIVPGVKPQYVTPELQVGMYVIKFRFQRPKNDSGVFNGGEDFKFKLLPVAASAIERRLSPASSSSTLPRIATEAKENSAAPRRRGRARPK